MLKKVIEMILSITQDMQFWVLYSFTISMRAMGKEAVLAETYRLVTG
jgi:hypothetical protein